jgi:hypothetical protein
MRSFDLYCTSEYAFLRPSGIVARFTFSSLDISEAFKYTFISLE